MKTIEVQGCATCPFSSFNDRSFTSAWYCKIARKGQNEPSEAPEWCPLRVEDRHITLKKGEGGW